MSKAVSGRGRYYILFDPLLWTMWSYPNNLIKFCVNILTVCILIHIYVKYLENSNSETANDKKTEFKRNFTRTTYNLIVT